ncbi:MAG: carboxymuconolactone decarboxylase family protein [Candidatus Krumholzibacteriota bacterium]|nr:carboxymuconolactone decarboxylase family protein [Candidatus Krumholzibacteriota bacterium]
MSDKWKKEFNARREEQNKIVFNSGHLGIKRFFALDEQAYHEGSLPTKTKELLGLVASLVLRCDDCVTFHLLNCHREGVTREEFYEAFNVALVVGGSIAIPHLRTAAEKVESLIGS